MVMRRGWFNQPSTLQPLHRMHGKKCVVNDTKEKNVTVYFSEGKVLSMVVPRNTLSFGFKES